MANRHGGRLTSIIPACEGPRIRRIAVVPSAQSRARGRENLDSSTTCRCV